jgi:multidrug efflux system membrane fusion protein
VNVRLQVSTLKDAVVIPVAAVQFGSKGTYVYVVNAKNKSTIRPVVLGATDGVLQSVTEGLAPGDAVVLEGLDRLREGKSVVVVKGEASVATAP